jgi:hypothetical protein
LFAIERLQLFHADDPLVHGNFVGRGKFHGLLEMRAFVDNLPSV